MQSCNIKAVQGTLADAKNQNTRRASRPCRNLNEEGREGLYRENTNEWRGRRLELKRSLQALILSS